MPRPARSAAGTSASWLSAQFVVGGLLEFTADPAMMAMFDDIGAGQGLRLCVGACEVAGAVGMLLPRLARWATTVLVLLLAGATVTNLVALQTSRRSRWCCRPWRSSWRSPARRREAHDEHGRARLLRRVALPTPDRLVGTWAVNGAGTSGTVRYAWFEGGAFLVQTVDLVAADGTSPVASSTPAGTPRAAPCGRTPSAAPVSSWTTPTNSTGDTLTIW